MIITLDEILCRGVYFIIPDEGGFYHCSIALAEGLQELNIPIFANKNYWAIDPDRQNFLFSHHANVNPEDCAIIVIDISACKELIIFEPKTDKENFIKVTIDQSDSDKWVPEFDRSDYILRTHMNRAIDYPANFVPWEFGISHRIKIATEPNQDFAERAREVLVNFRPSLNQTVRLVMEYILIDRISEIFQVNRTTETDEDKSVNFSPLDRLYYQQTGGRHHPSYYERLKNVQACSAYGGTFIYTNLIAKVFGKEMAPKPGIFRWDSWRFWESLAAGCVTIHLDFEKYGFALPVMPKNWEHYVGVDLDNPQEVIEKISDRPELFSEIADNGRKWALENYSPLATACRFLDLVMGEEMGTTQSLIKVLDRC
jgi:hypothetical protein